MPVRIVFNSEIVLKESYISRKEWKELGEEGILDLFEEDPIELVEKVGTIRKIINRVEWVTDEDYS